MIKVISIFGTRPEAIKMAPLIAELERNSDVIESKVCVTAQHREMLDQVLDIFDIIPDFDLDIMKNCQTLEQITTNALNGISDVLKKEKPDLIFVHGDTTTTMAASLAGFYNKIKVGHVEAGLRTFDKYSPFPEEMNRKITGTIADFHFSPTETNRKNLLNEGVPGDKIFVTGNTVIDSIKLTVRPGYKFKNEMLANLDFSKKLILLTAHRRENLGKPLENICDAVRRLAEKHSEITIVYPVHLNPKVRETVESRLSGIENIKLIDPINVDDLHNFMARCYLVLTDSGGLQEEAPSLGLPVLVLRTETERPEAVEAGTVKVVGVEEEDIFSATEVLLTDEVKYNKMARATNPYGDGEASARIVKTILEKLGD